jgi:hypothetical protein
MQYQDQGQYPVWAVFERPESENVDWRAISVHGTFDEAKKAVASVPFFDRVMVATTADVDGRLAIQSLSSSDTHTCHVMYDAEHTFQVSHVYKWGAALVGQPPDWMYKMPAGSFAPFQFNQVFT